MEPNNNSFKERMKTIDRIISAYRAKKLELLAQQERNSNPKNEQIYYEDLKDRMSKAYQRRKREKKINKLQKISSHWKGLS
jgi:hypothetical protein